MPFTLSHAALILPFGRRPFVASALTAGAVAPDLPYVLPRATSAAWGPYSDYNLTYTHRPVTGMIAGTVAALVLVALFQHVLKRPLIALLPEPAAGRLDGHFRWSAWVVPSAAIGVLSHLLADALVHDTDPDRRWWAATVAGAVALIVWLWFWWRRTSPAPAVTLRPAVRWSILAAIVAAGVLGAVVQVARSDYAGLATALRPAAAGAMAGVAVGVLLYAVVHRIATSRTEPQ